MRSRLRHISEMSTQGLNRLKRHIAQKEGVDEACIVFGCGSTAILNTVLERIAPRKVLTPDPVSQRHRAVLSKYSLECVTVPLKSNEHFELATEDFCNAMGGCDAALLPNPHHVTGTIISPEDIIKIADEADMLGISLVVDEAYGGYRGTPSLAGPISNSNGAVILRTFSTFHALGGLRLGYMIGPAGFMNHIEAALDPSWINSLAPWAAIASMKDKGYHRRTLLFVEEEKAYIRDKVSRIKDAKCYVSPSNMLVIKLQKEGHVVQKRLGRYKILIHIFADENGDTCVRFPVQTHRLNAYFVRILKRIMEA